MLKLRRLRIDKFRSVEPATDLRFSDAANVLLGQNGTGKTTLLELISRVVRSDFSGLAEEEFAIAYEVWVDGITITTEFRNQRETSPAPTAFAGRETFRPSMIAKVRTPDGRLFSIQHKDGKLDVNGKPVDDPAFWARFDLFDPGVPALLAAVNSIWQGLIVPFSKSKQTVRFDESLDLFRTVMATNQTRLEVKFLQPGPVFIPDLTTPQPWAISLTPKLEQAFQENPSHPSFTFSHTELDFLGKVTRLMGFDSATLRIDVLERESRGSAAEHIKFGNLSLRFAYKNGDFVTHERLSYGQKRLLMFFYYLDACPDVVIADELVNGLHHQWINACIDAIGERQSFLTSQNPLLLDYLPFSSREQIRNSFVLCKGEQREARPPWSWTNMSEEDAAEFFSAYEIGVEHVSEILQSRGLW